MPPTAPNVELSIGCLRGCRPFELSFPRGLSSGICAYLCDQPKPVSSRKLIYMYVDVYIFWKYYRREVCNLPTSVHYDSTQEVLQAVLL